MLVFLFWWEIVLGATYLLRVVQYSYAVVSGFWLWRGIVLKMREYLLISYEQFLQKKYWVTTLHYDPLANVYIL